MNEASIVRYNNAATVKFFDYPEIAEFSWHTDRELKIMFKAITILKIFCIFFGWIITRTQQIEKCIKSVSLVNFFYNDCYYNFVYKIIK